MSSTLASYASINPKLTPADVFVFSLPDFSQEGPFVAVDSYCVQPSCPCRLVSLQIERVPESPAQRDPHPERFFLHLDSLELLDVHNAPLDLDTHPMAAAMRATLSLDALELWRRHYEEGRIYGLENSWQYRNWDDLEPGEMIAYSEVWETAPLVALEMKEGGMVAVVERFCPSPRCDCKEALLSFVRTHEDEQELDESGEAVVKLQLTGQYQLEGAGVFTPDEVTRLVQAFKDRPAALKTLREHYQRIKVVGGELAKRYPALAKSWGMTGPSSALAPGSAQGETGSRTVKVGRNEPCPCGSGKKFKQCCGRNS